MLSEKKRDLREDTGGEEGRVGLGRKTTLLYLKGKSGRVACDPISTGE